MNVFVFYILMQEIFIDEIHFFKFPYMNDKQWLDQLKVLLNFMVQASLNLSIRTRKWNTIMEGEIPYSKDIYEASVTYQAH